MKLFTTIAIESAGKCNRTCWFCPNGENKRPDNYMDLKVIESLAEQLGELKYTGRVALYMYNEPLRDKRILEIISLLRNEVPRSCIMISTNCDYLKNEKDLMDLFGAGLNQIQLNIYSGLPQYQKVEDILKLCPDLKSGNVYSNSGPRKKIFSLENKYEIKPEDSDKKVGRFELSNRSGNVAALPSIPEPLKKMCVRPFRSMQINWKGDVVLCCNDYHAKVICGNIVKASIVKVWEESEVFKQYRQKLLKKQRNLPLCDNCSFKGGAYTHMVKAEDFGL